jgi:G3E family GTPase
LNHILTAGHGKKLAVIENEFGEASVDDKLLAKNKQFVVDETIETFANGCLCCTFRKDLVKVLRKFSKRIESGLQLDGVIIETTGMAEPAPVAQTFFINDEVKSFFRLDGIVTLVDAKHIEQHLDEETPEGTGNESVEQVAFADRMLLNKTDLVTEADLLRIEGRLRAINEFAPIQRCMNSQVSVDSVLNIRGFDPERALEMVPEFHDNYTSHPHDKSVSSLSFTYPGAVDLSAVQQWMGEILQHNGNDIYRMKGVLAVENADQKFVYQGVHMLFDGKFDEVWSSDEKQESRLVFIGKNLDKWALEEGFKACVVTPESEEKKRKSLRFAMGEEVECYTRKGWKRGEVVALLYRVPWNNGMDPGVIAPYQVKLDNGDLIFAPDDRDEVIRKAR